MIDIKTKLIKHNLQTLVMLKKSLVNNDLGVHPWFFAI